MVLEVHSVSVVVLGSAGLHVVHLHPRATGGQLQHAPPMVWDPQILSRFQAMQVIQARHAVLGSLSVPAEMHSQGAEQASGLDTTAVEHEWFLEHVISVVGPAIPDLTCAVTNPAHSIQVELQHLHSLDLASAIYFVWASADSWLEIQINIVLLICYSYGNTTL